MAQRHTQNWPLMQNSFATRQSHIISTVMNLEIEPVADIATGAIIASAFEPDAGNAGKSAASPCLNCNAQLDGPFCRNCGQKAKVHRTLSAFWHDLIHGVFHFDGKIWRTLPMLVWHPGKLTRRYVHGERAKFVSPLALFLFSVFVTFASVNALFPKSFGSEIETPASIAKGLADDQREAENDLKKLQADLRETKAGGENTAAIEVAIKLQTSKIAKIESEQQAAAEKQQRTEADLDKERAAIRAKIARIEADIAAAKKAGTSTVDLEANLAGERLGLKMLNNAAVFVDKGTDADLKDYDVNLWGIESLNRSARHAMENPQLVMYKVQSSAYKYAWLLIIMSTPFVWLMFAWRRQYMVFDHAVFVTYSLCFMLLLTTFGSFALRFEDWLPLTIIVLTFAPALHMYRQLKEAYVLTRFSALWRTAVLSTFAALVLGLFLGIIITLGMTG
jgi:Protein of unknown function (DUF3667)